MASNALTVRRGLWPKANILTSKGGCVDLKMRTKGKGAKILKFLRTLHTPTNLDGGGQNGVSTSI